MTQPPVHVHRLPHRIKPDASRMITRFFAGDEEANRGRIERVLTLPAAEAQGLLAAELERALLRGEEPPGASLITRPLLPSVCNVIPLIPGGTCRESAGASPFE